jgi:hypothetical protein
MSPANNNAASSLGITMALPPGTASQLESLRQEELKRRQMRERLQVEQLKQEGSSVKKDVETRHLQQQQPRRLAPQRRKPQETKPTEVGTVESERLPVNIPISTELNVDDDVDTDNDVVDEEGELQILRNMADWTLNDTNQTSAILHDEVNEQSEESYHGEIESYDDEQNNSTTNINEESDDEDSIDPGYNPIDELALSLDPPPPSLPLVLVNLEQLCGCPPSDEEEKEVLVGQIVEALLGTVPEAGGDGEEQQKEEGEETDHTRNSSKQALFMAKGDGLSLDFDARVVELFESGVARHVDSLTPAAVFEMNSINTQEQPQKAASPFAIVPYPEFLSSDPSPSSGITRSTIRLWKLLHTSHPLPVLNRLFGHLRNTSRSLIWKADMHQELRRLARQEHISKKHRDQREEYNQWKETVRKERLEKLYEVRETFLLRVDVAKKKYDDFAEERERRVKRELWRRRGGVIDEEGIDKKDSHHHDMHYEEDDYHDSGSYDDDGWGGVIKEDDILGEDTQSKQDALYSNFQDDGVDESDDEDEDYSPVGMNIVVGEGNTKAKDTSTSNVSKDAEIVKPVTNELEPITADDNKQRKAERLQMIKDQSDVTDSIKHKVVLKKEEESVREMLKSTDERLAEAALRSLEQRLKTVDDLLESLQEEEWADEEADEELDRTESNANEEEVIDAPQMSLLDQVLAMILGALPKECSGSKTDEEHFGYVKEEHATLVKHWVETFGRLPTSFAEDEQDKRLVNEPKRWDDGFPSEKKSPSPSKQQSAHKDITFIGNEENNWEDMEYSDWDALLHTKL